MNPLGVHENLLPGCRCDNKSAFLVYFKCSGELESYMKEGMTFFLERKPTTCGCVFNVVAGLTFNSTGLYGEMFWQRKIWGDTLALLQSQSL